MKRGGVGTGSKCLSFAYGLPCALQFCVGKTADGLFVADKFNFSDFLTETELYKQKRTRSFCLLGRRSASFLRLNEFFREPVIPNSFRNPTQRRLNIWTRFGIFPKGDLTFGQGSGFSREEILRLDEVRGFPESRFNAWGRFGIFPKGDLTLGKASGFSRMLHKL